MDKEQKRIERLLKLTSDAQLAEYDAINSLEDDVVVIEENLSTIKKDVKLLDKGISSLTKQIDKVEKMEGPKGPKGDKGDKGDPGKDGKDGEDGLAPDHKWKGTELMFKKPDGTWGKAVDLQGPPGVSVTMRRNGGGGGTSTGNNFPDGLILKSPNGTSFLLGVDDDGSLTTTNL
jgi:hypothetical protein